MSKPDTTTSINITSLPEEQAEVVEKRPNILVRGIRKARSNPKNTLAVVGGVALVSAAAFLGRKTAPSCDYSQPLPEEVDYEVVELVEEPDTTVA